MAQSSCGIGMKSSRIHPKTNKSVGFHFSFGILKLLTELRDILVIHFLIESFRSTQPTRFKIFYLTHVI